MNIEMKTLAEPVKSVGAQPLRVHDYALRLALFDLAALTVTFWSAWLLRFYFGVGWGAISTYVPIYILAVALFGMAAVYENSYRSDIIRDQLKSIAAALKSAALMFGAIVFAGFAIKVTSSYSRLWAVGWALAFTAVLALSRVYLSRRIARNIRGGLVRRSVAVIGAGEKGQRTYSAICKDTSDDMQVVAFLDDRSDRVPKMVGDVPVIGSVRSLPAILDTEKLDLVAIALPWMATERIAQLRRFLSRYAVDVVLIPDHIGLGFDYADNIRVGNHLAPALSRRPIDGWSALWKRAEDLAVAGAALLALWPVLLVTAIAIKATSKGPVLFRQKRYGFNNELIEIYKFRSMFTDMADRDADKLATKNDARITPVGRFIRKTSIDELPQIFNVLEGTMSIVGPRPHATQAKAAGQLYEQVVDEYAERHRMKPGITGWAQANGWRGETDTEEKIRKRVEYDLYYINNWSLWLDIYIILKTAYVVVFDRSNAY